MKTEVGVKICEDWYGCLCQEVQIWPQIEISARWWWSNVVKEAQNEDGSQSLVLIPTAIWIKQDAHMHKPKNKKKPRMFCEEEWTKINILYKYR